MPSRINMGPDGGPYIAINENNGDIELEDNSGNVVAKWDESATQWDFQSNDLTNVGAAEVDDLDATQTADLPWSDFSDVSASRSFDTTLQNSEGVELEFAVTVRISPDTTETLTAFAYTQESSTGIIDPGNRAGFVQIQNHDEQVTMTLRGTVAPGHHYRIRSGGDETIKNWNERTRDAT